MLLSDKHEVNLLQFEDLDDGPKAVSNFCLTDHLFRETPDYLVSEAGKFPDADLKDGNHNF